MSDTISLTFVSVPPLCEFGSTVHGGTLLCTLHMRYQRYHIKLQKHQKFGIELICFNNILYKHIAAHFLLHKLILFSQKKECTVHSQFPKLYQMISKYKSRTICLG